MNGSGEATSADATSPAPYTIRDLATLSGCSVRTVRYYRARGLLAGPLRGRTSAATYGAAHLTRLRAIRAERERNRTLSSLVSLFSQPRRTP